MKSRRERHGDYQTQRKVKDPATGKKVPLFDKGGNPVMHSKWRTTIFDHNGVRKTFTLTTTSSSPKNMLT